MMSVDTNEKALSGLSERALAFSVDSLLGRSLPVEHQSLVQVSKEITQREDQSNSIPQQKTQTKLCKRDLWCKFHRFGNEMILTKTGRRIFPPLQVEIFNLSPECYYIIWVEMLPMDAHRYKYVFTSSQWMIAGKCDPPFPNNRYYHPDGVATGKHWMSRPVSLDKLKLTNNKHPIQKDQMTLRSMHKYQPKIHVQLVDGPENQRPMMDAHSTETFTFPETSFITVTAYQNQEITRLKIECNRFAKGFRESKSNRNPIGNNYREREGSCNFGMSAFTPIVPSLHPVGCWYGSFTNRQALEPVPCTTASRLSTCRCLPHYCANQLCAIEFCHQCINEDLPVEENAMQIVQQRIRNKQSYHPYILKTF